MVVHGEGLLTGKVDQDLSDPERAHRSCPSRRSAGGGPSGRRCLTPFPAAAVSAGARGDGGPGGAPAAKRGRTTWTGEAAPAPSRAGKGGTGATCRRPPGRGSGRGARWDRV